MQPPNDTPQLQPPQLPTTTPPLHRSTLRHTFPPTHTANHSLHASEGAATQRATRLHIESHPPMTPAQPEPPKHSPEPPIEATEPPTAAPLALPPFPADKLDAEAKPHHAGPPSKAQAANAATLQRYIEAGYRRPPAATRPFLPTHAAQPAADPPHSVAQAPRLTPPAPRTDPTGATARDGAPYSGPLPSQNETVEGSVGESLSGTGFGVVGVQDELKLTQLPPGSYVRSDGVVMRPVVRGGQVRGALRVGGPGRPPRLIRAAAAQSFDMRLRIAEAIADDPGAKNLERLAALELIGKFGVGTASAQLDDRGRAMRDRTVRVIFDRKDPAAPSRTEGEDDEVPLGHIEPMPEGGDGSS